MKHARKAVVALVGVVAQAVNLGLLPEQWQEWAAVVIALATAVGVYQAPNVVEDRSGRYLREAGWTTTDTCLAAIAAAIVLWAIGVVPLDLNL